MFAPGCLNGHSAEQGVRAAADAELGRCVEALIFQVVYHYIHIYLYIFMLIFHFSIRWASTSLTSKSLSERQRLYPTQTCMQSKVSEQEQQIEQLGRRVAALELEKAELASRNAMLQKLADIRADSRGSTESQVRTRAGT